MCDDAFREQLEAKERVYHSNLGRLAAEKDKEIDLANQKVSCSFFFYISLVYSRMIYSRMK